MADHAERARAELRRLWGLAPSGRPGPKASFTAREVAAAAISLADAEGVDRLSMRRVAERLGTSAMALYAYVPGKAELVELMVDEVAGEISGPSGETWREAAIVVAEQNLALYRRHPWLLAVDDHRPVLGPNIIRKYELELRAFDGLGLDDWRMDAALGSLLAFTRGCAQAEAAAVRARSSSGVSDAEWWAARAPILAQLDLEARFPLASRVGAAAGERAQAPRSTGDAFSFGLDCWLRGMAEVLASGPALPEP